jgi:hypothetical protein
MRSCGAALFSTQDQEFSMPVAARTTVRLGAQIVNAMRIFGLIPRMFVSLVMKEPCRCRMSVSKISPHRLQHNNPNF